LFSNSIFPLDRLRGFLLRCERQWPPGEEGEEGEGRTVYTGRDATDRTRKKGKREGGKKNGVLPSRRIDGMTLLRHRRKGEKGEPTQHTQNGLFSPCPTLGISSPARGEGGEERKKKGKRGGLSACDPASARALRRRGGGERSQFRPCLAESVMRHPPPWKKKERGKKKKKNNNVGLYDKERMFQTRGESKKKGGESQGIFQFFDYCEKRKKEEAAESDNPLRRRHREGRRGGEGQRRTTPPFPSIEIEEEKKAGKMENERGGPCEQQGPHLNSGIRGGEPEVILLFLL